VSGNKAVAVSYGHAFHAQALGDGQNLWLLYCRYEHEFTVVGGAWRLNAVKMRPAPTEERAPVRRRRAAAVARALTR